ncbi:MAG: hypothetical protein HYX28_09225 [Candidatus Koribacter versatilis]|uniref:Protein RecA n=1 Tax=Candidatus Korobacter versatilis TaxID=658062 RepID=A0A932A940_9BACT|nr:hypothetical protein [Candidatus Koribacter versatilis]
MASPLAVPTVDLSALPAGCSKFHLIKAQVEAALEKKVPSALTLRERPAAVCLPTGVAEVDALSGGIPRGALSEFTGPASSGRTSLLLSLLAQVTARHEFCALLDATGSFDPASAEIAGVDLARLLWVKCSAGVPPAVSVASRRRGVAEDIPGTCKMPALRPLERCLRVADLLLMNGGFGLIALDLGDVSPDAARRVPLTTWFRFCRAVEGTPTALVVLEQEPHAKSCAKVVLELQPADFSLQSSTGTSPAHARIFTGLHTQAALIRGHAQKKFAASSKPTQFSASTAWTT